MARRFHLPVPGPEALSAPSAKGRAKRSRAGAAPGEACGGSEERAVFVWRDPVSGESLTLEFVAEPELIAQLESAGFRRVDHATDPPGGNAAA